VLRRNPDIVIATPGRLIDHLKNTPTFTLDSIEVLVLDEADRYILFSHLCAATEPCFSIQYMFVAVKSAEKEFVPHLVHLLLLFHELDSLGILVT
jgi:hypothetical protein